MLDSAVLLLITSAVALFVTLVVAAAHTIGRWIKASFAAVLTSLILWQATIFTADRVDSNLLFWNHLVFLWPTLAVLSFFAFVTLLRSSPEKHRKGSHKTSVILVIAAAVQGVAVASGNIFSEITYDPATSAYIFNRGVFYPVYLLGLTTMLTVVVSRLLINFTATKKYPQERKAFRVVLITVGTAVVYGTCTNVLLPLFTDSQEYISLGLITVDIFAIGFALSIVRHQFLDIRAYVFRAVVYLITLLLAAVVYVGVASLLSSYLLDISLDRKAIAMLSLITLLVAVSFQPLRNRFDRSTNRFFFRDYYNSEDVLDKLGDLLVRTVDPDAIKEQSKALFHEALKPTSLTYLLIAEKPKREEAALLKQLLQSNLNIVVPYELDRNRYPVLAQALRNENIAIAAKLRTKHEDLGFMLLGFRQSGAGYSLGDRKFLGLVADQLAIGLQNALRFQEIENFNATLQERITEATKKLRRTNDKLRTLDQTKDDFISMASHQLRTPLTSVKGYVSMVLDGDAGKISVLQRKLLNQAFISSQRMVYLISDLLNVSRLRTGKFIIEPMPTNLATIVQDEVEQLQETAKGRNLELAYNRPEHFPTFMLDETKLRQVIMNFIDNAIYYTPSGGHITINLVDKPLSIEFTVVDNGIGVPKREQHHIFTKFFRAHNAKRARPDGTGLGLFMAKKVVIAQGGAVLFRSHEGKGSMFGFSFAKERLTAAPAKPQKQISTAL